LTRAGSLTGAIALTRLIWGAESDGPVLATLMVTTAGFAAAVAVAGGPLLLQRDQRYRSFNRRPDLGGGSAPDLAGRDRGPSAAPGCDPACPDLRDRSSA
jgi:hypothetical protein